MCVHACVYVYIAGRIDIASCNESGGRGKGQGRGEEREGARSRFVEATTQAGRP